LLTLIDNDRSVELVTKTVPVVIDQMYDLSGYWYIENGEVISNNVICTQTGEGESETDSRAFPIYGSLVTGFGSFIRDANSGEYSWRMDASKLPPGASPEDVTFSATAVQTANGVTLNTHTVFPQPASSNLPLSPQNKEVATAGIGLAALPIIPLAWLGVRRKSRAMLAGALLLCLLVGGCSGFVFLYGTIDSQVTFTTIEQTNNTQPAVITFGGAAPEGLYRLSDGVARYTVDFTMGGGLASIEGTSESSSHCTGTIDVAATGYVYKDLKVIFPEDDED